MPRVKKIIVKAVATSNAIHPQMTQIFKLLCNYLAITPKVRGLEHEQSERPRKTRKLLGQETFALFVSFRAIRVPNVIALESFIKVDYRTFHCKPIPLI